MDDYIRPLAAKGLKVKGGRETSGLPLCDQQKYSFVKQHVERAQTAIIKYCEDIQYPASPQKQRNLGKTLERLEEASAVKKKKVIEVKEQIAAPKLEAVERLMKLEDKFSEQPRPGAKKMVL